MLGVKSGTAWDSSQIPSFITAPLPDLATPYFATQSGKDNYCIQTVANNSVVMQREIINGAVGSWKRTDNFGCNTPADLASLLGAFSSIGDITSTTNESDLVFGFYRFSLAANKTPSWWYGSSSDNGVLFCIKQGSSFCTLIAISSTSKIQIKQVYWSITIDWKSITMA